MNRTMSAEESTITPATESASFIKNINIDNQASRTKSLEAVSQENYECSICLSWLKDPVRYILMKN